MTTLTTRKNSSVTQAEQSAGATVVIALIAWANFCTAHATYRQKSHSTALNRLSEREHWCHVFNIAGKLENERGKVCMQR